MRVLVTGSNGFVGRALADHLATRTHYDVRRAVRRMQPSDDSRSTVAVGDIGPSCDWTEALRSVDVVVHAAARVHVMRERAGDPLTEFRRVNTAGTTNLAMQAAAAGVHRLVYVSTIKVNGETTTDRAFSADDAPAPRDAYGISKYETELELRKIGQSTQLEISIVRPVLVYGPRVGGNFKTMMQALARGRPLPLGAVRNHRSFVALANLISVLERCISHPNAANQIFLVSDGEDLSTPELLRRLATALERRARLIPIPSSMLMAAAAVIGRRETAQRLLGSLQVDIAKTRERLDWTPPMSVDEGLRAAARSFLTDR